MRRNLIDEKESNGYIFAMVLASVWPYGVATGGLAISGAALATVATTQICLIAGIALAILGTYTFLGVGMGIWAAESPEEFHNHPIRVLVLGGLAVPLLIMAICYDLTDAVARSRPCRFTLVAIRRLLDDAQPIER